MIIDRDPNGQLTGIWTFQNNGPNNDHSWAAAVGNTKHYLLWFDDGLQREGWTVAGGEIFFIDRPTSARPAAIRGFNPRTDKARSSLDLDEVFLDRGDISVSVSADGKSLLYAQLDRSGSNVIIAEKNH